MAWQSMRAQLNQVSVVVVLIYVFLSIFRINNGNNDKSYLPLSLSFSLTRNGIIIKDEGIKVQQLEE